MNYQIVNGPNTLAPSLGYNYGVSGNVHFAQPLVPNYPVFAHYVPHVGYFYWNILKLLRTFF